MKTRTAFLLVFALIVSACQIRFDTAVVINEDGSGTFAIEISLDEEFRQLSEDQGGELDMTEGFEEDPPEGWDVEPFVDGEFEGVRVVTSFDNLDQLSSRLDQLSEVADEDDTPTDLFGELNITQDGSSFRFEATPSGLEEGFSGGEGFEGFDPAQLFSQIFQIRLRVTLPGTPGDNNADEVDGNTFIWNVLLADEGTEYFAESTAGGGGLSPIVLAVLVIAIAAIVFVVLSRRNGGGEPVAAVADPGPADDVDPAADPFAGVDSGGSSEA